MPVFFLGLLMGTASTLLIKATYDVGAIDPVTSQSIPYQKPIFLTFIMFVGMFGSLPLYMFLTRNAKKASTRDVEIGSNAEKSPLLASNADLSMYTSDNPFGDEQVDQPITATTDEPEEEQFNIWSLKLMLILMIPSIFDLLGTVLSTIGLLYVSVSLYQLSRCSVIIVTALFKRVILKHKLSTANYAGVTINTLAMLLVGAAAILLEVPQAPEGLSAGAEAVTHESSSKTLTGLLFILASCIVQGAQYVFEEKVMSFDNVPPLVLIGFEGLNGCLLSIFVAFPFAMLMPGDDNGYYEDIYSAFTLPFHSPALFWILFTFFIIIFLYNVFCIYITFLLSSIYHCVMDGLRPCAVWLTSLGSYYILGLSGQPWSTICWFELTSMALIFYGTAVYAGQVKLPCLPAEKLGEEAKYDPSLDNIPIRDTPVFSARIAQQNVIGDNEQVNATGLLTQSPTLRAGQPATVFEKKQHQPHGHVHSGMPLAQQNAPSSRAPTQHLDERAMY